MIANAVVPMDEDSPHMHVVGVSVGAGYKEGNVQAAVQTKGSYQRCAFR